MFPHYLVKLKTTQKQPTTSFIVFYETVVRNFDRNPFNVCFKKIVSNLLKNSFCSLRESFYIFTGFYQNIFNKFNLYNFKLYFYEVNVHDVRLCQQL